MPADMRGFTCALSLAMASTMMIILSVNTNVAARHEYNRDSLMGYQDITEEDSQSVNKRGACPKTDWETGPCTETCSSDSYCEGDLKCCTVRCGKENGGRSCQKPVNENQCSIRCTKILEPVCGTDGVTYGNECALREAVCSSNQGFIKTAYEGECLPTKTGPCTRQYQNAIGSLLMHKTGQQIPTCDKHGFYKPMQCSGSTGACWCVTKNGKTVEAPADVFINSDEDCLKFLDDNM